MGEVVNFQECSFCGKHKTVVQKLIVGDSTAICNDCVTMCVDLLKDDDVPGAPETNSAPYPTDIKAFLDQYVVGQDRAKKVLSVAVSNHYKRISNKNQAITPQKSNVLMFGPTGSGKTMLARTIARYLNVPFVVADATSLTEAGYVGDDVESMIARLVAEADGDVELAQRGIVFIDEIDKISRKSESASLTRDVSGEGVQQALLKLVEGTRCRIPISGRRKNPNADVHEVDTTDILFIAGGAFVGLGEIVAKRLERNSIGFGAPIKNSKKLQQYLDKVTPDDLTKYGMIPEFTGRFTSHVALTELTKADLRQVLTGVKNSYIDQYKFLLSLDNLELTFTDGAIDAITENCLKLGTGARGLHNEVERVLMPVMYGIRGLLDFTKEVTVTEADVGDPDGLLTRYMEAK